MLSKDCCMLLDCEMAIEERSESGTRNISTRTEVSRRQTLTFPGQPNRPGKSDLSAFFFRHGSLQKGVQLVAGYKQAKAALRQKIGQAFYIRQANNTAVSFDWIPVAGGLRGLGECRYPPLFFSKKIEYAATDTMVSSQG